MDNVNTRSAKKYFAAANSYFGFVSFFDEIFRSESFTRIYVLKGGPGTGKNSFMKAIIRNFAQYNCKIEEIYCSSDPASLDGVILTYENKKIGILDGTSPHERDAVFPGTIDELINLGDGWKKDVLIAQREKISELSKEKARAYATAYSYLKIAGAADDFIIREYRRDFDILRAKSKAECILSSISDTKDKNISRQIISSFGKYGYYKITDIGELCDRKVQVFGDEFSAVLFMEIILEKLLEVGENIINFPSALNIRYSDGIIASNLGLGIITGGGEDISSNEFIKTGSNLMARVKCAKEVRMDSLEAAKRWFTIASDMHFRLEDIYSQAMNFQINNELIQQETAEIKKYLEIER